MRMRLVYICVALLAQPGIAAADKPIHNLVDQAVPTQADGSPHSIDYIQAAIIKACAVRGWQPLAEGEGKISATINVRGRHYAKISIPFFPTRYSILYVESEGLDYNPKKQKIHKNYNNWVVKLSASINKEISTGVPVTESENQTTLYGDLMKLSELRDKGLLTDQEFEEEKRKLLQRN